MSDDQVKIDRAAFNRIVDELISFCEDEKDHRKVGTPAARWREDGETDPHGARYNCERAALAMGDATDDELANAVFLYDHRNGIESARYLTAAKDRIRWLSRALEEALKAAA